MCSILRVILICIFSAATVYSNSERSASNVFPNSSVFSSSSDTSVNIDETRNRLPFIITDAKLLMSEVVISDFNKDTLEVEYLVSKIFELLNY